MWTEVLATYAAVVSTASASMAYVSYRAGGPNLSGEAYIMGRRDRQGPTLHINLRNRGRGPITVDSAWLAGIGVALNRDLPVTGWPLRSSSCTLPVRVEGHSGVRWSFSAVDVVTAWLSRADLKRLEVTVSLANGNQLILKVDTENVDDLDPDNLPAWDPGYFDRPTPSGGD